MNLYLALAGSLTLVLALVHSVAGELLLLGRLSRECLPPLAGDRPFVRRSLIALFGTTGERGIRLLRVTWHLPSVLGGGFAGMLLRLAWPASADTHLAFITTAVAVSIAGCSLLVLLGCTGKHPGVGSPGTELEFAL